MLYLVKSGKLPRLVDQFEHSVPMLSPAQYPQGHGLHLLFQSEGRVQCGWSLQSRRRRAHADHGRRSSEWRLGDWRSLRGKPMDDGKKPCYLKPWSRLSLRPLIWLPCAA